jgi:2-polyprenyl-3-methyl-5-hydroxy-6-metoxy-1,4-benzoquinol methylase
MSLMLDEHRLYLTDRTRTSLFRRAINAVVKPGDVVLDLACGTGVLGMLAMKAGAARLYQVDLTGMIQIARDVARANGCGQTATGIRQVSSRATLPEMVDVVVADQLSHFGIGGGMPEIFNDARQRFLKPGGRTIPRRIELFVTPVNFPEMWSAVSFWDKKPAGLNMTPAHVIAFNTGYPAENRPRRMLGKPARMVTFDLTELTPEHVHAEAEIEVSTAGVMHGLSGWFVAELAPGINMTNSPFSKGRITRRAAFLPIERPVDLRKGDRVKIKMGVVAAQTMLSWTVTVCNSRGEQKARFVHSTLKGMLLAPEDLAKTRPDYVPSLSKWGEARRSTVNLIDGKRTVAEIERELFRIHGDLFPSLAKASEYATEVLIPYGLETQNAKPSLDVPASPRKRTR